MIMTENSLMESGWEYVGCGRFQKGECTIYVFSPLPGALEARMMIGGKREISGNAIACDNQQHYAADLALMQLGKQPMSDGKTVYEFATEDDESRF